MATKSQEARYPSRKSLNTSALDTMTGLLNQYGGFLYPKSSIYRRIVHAKASVLGIPHLWKHPHQSISIRFSGKIDRKPWIGLGVAMEKTQGIHLSERYPLRLWLMGAPPAHPPGQLTPWRNGYFPCKTSSWVCPTDVVVLVGLQGHKWKAGKFPSPAIAMVIIGGYTWSKMLNWDLTSRICSVYQFSSTCGSNPNILYEYMPKATSGQDQVHLSCTVRYIWDVHKIKNHMVNAQPVPLQM